MDCTFKNLDKFMFYLCLPSATYFFSTAKKSKQKRAAPQVPGRLIFRKYLERVHQGQWPATFNNFKKPLPKRNRAENHDFLVQCVL